MIVIRCTKRLLPRLAPRGEAEGSAPVASVMGDWHANLLGARKNRRPTLAIFVNDRTRLGVIVPAAPVATLLARFRAAVGSLLRTLGVAEHAIGHELDAMSSIAIAPTADRSVIGTMTEYAFAIDADDVRSWHELSVWLADQICMTEPSTPRTATRRLFDPSYEPPRRGSGRAILDALARGPKLEPGDVQALEAAIEEGKLPVDDKGCFDHLIDEDETDA